MADSWWAEGEVGICIYGLPWIAGPAPRQVSAEELLQSYLERGVEAFTTLDGGFVIVVADFRSDTFLVMNDRMATHPVHYFAGKGVFAVAPEAKAILAMLGRVPELDTHGCLTFLEKGHALGERTLFNDVRLLPPAQLLRVDLASGEVRRETYWDLRFGPAAKTTRRAAADNLHDILGASHAAVLLDSPAESTLLLTGGFDSRVMLGGFRLAGQLPARALTWGVSAEIPFSDPQVAAGLASGAGLEWEFRGYGEESFPERAEAWARVGELGSDNLGVFAAGPDFLAPEGAPIGPVFIGDQFFGYGGQPLSMEDAVIDATGIRLGALAPAVTRIMNVDRVAEASAAVHEDLAGVIARCPNDTPKGLKDFLSYQVGLARWLNAPTFFREPMVSTRRPLLGIPALELFLTLPEHLRVDKAVLVDMLRRHFPDLAAVPRATANSLIDWGHAFTHPGPCRDYLEGLLNDDLIEALPIHSFLDMDRVRADSAAFLNSRRTEVSRAPDRKSLITSLRRVTSRVPGLARWLRRAEHRLQRMRGVDHGPKIDRVLIRLALLVMLQRVVSRGELSLTSAAPVGGEGLPPVQWRREG